MENGILFIVCFIKKTGDGGIGLVAFFNGPLGFCLLSM